ncbi:MAG TPA: hypothetical protein DDW52_29970, partial [Planctomycetaceae bacterium]|nr:hypothetical protein [Planctomycetaceae bacterium]
MIAHKSVRALRYTDATNFQALFSNILSGVYRTMISRLSSLLVVVTFLNVSIAQKPPVDGRWVWSSDVEGVEVDFELHLVAENDKVTGTLKAPKMELDAKVQDGGIDDGNVWFDIEFERGGADVKASFSGEYDASVIEGDVEVSLDG